MFVSRLLLYEARLANLSENYKTFYDIKYNLFKIRTLFIVTII